MAQNDNEKTIEQTISDIIKSSGIKADVVQISPPFRWIMELRKVTLSDGKTLLFKIGFNDKWTDEAVILNHVALVKMLRYAGIPQPQVLSYEADKSIYGFRFLLFEGYEGKKLGEIYKKSDMASRVKLFESLGHAYNLIHNKMNPWSGLWDGSPDKKKYSIHPARFYSDAEFHNGSGKNLYESGKISESLFQEICSIWDSNLQYLENRPASLVHVSPFPWSIYLTQKQDAYFVTGFSALADFMWWDAMSDVAHILYPPFMDITDEERNGFLRQYQREVDYKAISLYKLLNRICALSEVYMAPLSQSIQNEWINRQLSQLHNIASEIRKLF